jgi:hypothetical protein
MEKGKLVHDQKIAHWVVAMLFLNFKVVQIWPGQTVTCLHTNRPGHIKPLCMNGLQTHLVILWPHNAHLYILFLCKL